MKYMGSKNRLAKYIVPIIQQKMKENNLSTYVEPFVGGANVIDKVVADKKIGCDKQPYLIALYENLDKIKTLPETVTREHYSSVKQAYTKGLDTYEDWYIGAIGFLASYNGKFFDGGYAAPGVKGGGVFRDYYAEARRNLEKQISNLKDIEWKCGDYRELCSNYENCLIYCDPPYFGTTQYSVSKNFCHDDFWEWCKEMSKKNIVLISEYTARNDFKQIWEAPLKKTVGAKNHIDTTERLFEYNKEINEN